MIKITCIITSSGKEAVTPYLSRCIESLKRSSKGTKIKIFIVLVLDTSISYLADQLKVDKTIVSGNIGFGNKNNLGIDYVLH